MITILDLQWSQPATHGMILRVLRKIADGFCTTSFSDNNNHLYYGHTKGEMNTIPLEHKHSYVAIVNRLEGYL